MCKPSNQSLILLGFVFVGCLLFYCNFSIVIVKGESMEPTYENHDILLAIKNTKTINRKDVIVFKDLSNQICIKRVLACGEDSVLLRNGHIYVNNVKMREYIYEGKDTEYHLSRDEYFVVGDNKQNSLDSRLYGPIKKDKILGVILKGENK